MPDPRFTLVPDLSHHRVELVYRGRQFVYVRAGKELELFLDDGPPGLQLLLTSRQTLKEMGERSQELEDRGIVSQQDQERLFTAFSQVQALLKHPPCAVQLQMQGMAEATMMLIIKDGEHEKVQVRIYLTAPSPKSIS